jgi:hypothetical protein
MKTILILILALSAQAQNCRLKNPIPLPQNSEEWIMRNPKFSPQFTTGTLAKDYPARPMSLEIFRIYRDSVVTNYVGAALRESNRTPWWSWIGFSVNYTLRTPFEATLTPIPRGVIYWSKVMSITTPQYPDPMVTELKLTIENHKITELVLTVPHTLPCRVKDNQAWCDWTGDNETSCLVSGEFQ